MKCVFSWSGGKDSALALYKVLKSKEFDVVGLLTTFNEANKRVSMHGVTQEFIEEQAKAIGVPLISIYLPENSSMEMYNQIMHTILLEQKGKGVQGVIFGDIFLDDLRQYREKQLGKLGLMAFFPLWNMSTNNVADEFIAAGFKAVVSCVDGSLLKKTMAGKMYNRNFIADLPVNVDVCGENGEFHSFVFDGPIFKNPILYKRGKNVARNYANPQEGNTKTFWFADLNVVSK